MKFALINEQTFLDQNGWPIDHSITFTVPSDDKYAFIIAKK